MFNSSYWNSTYPYLTLYDPRGMEMARPVAQSNVAAYAAYDAVDSAARGFSASTSRGYIPGDFSNESLLPPVENVSNCNTWLYSQAIAEYPTAAWMDCGTSAEYENDITLEQGRGQRRKKEAKFSCPQCQKKLTTKQRLHTHVQSIHLKISKTLVCCYCSSKLTGSRSLLRHQGSRKACPYSPLAKRQMNKVEALTTPEINQYGS
ncbi:hypothetical protein D9757_001218 [Collybiopsis confluens]|uniref:C2H2-type domain-containing protein n=1 Tax=Collybiopsis confluens TaxID=2823264 RepID=A0A8H5I0K2_9AGAR|nr:hypothetical protein D9757_001218 [Collybiopsis confluens]